MSKIIHVSYPVYANAEGTAVNCTVLHEDFGKMPFTASPDDIFTDYGPDIYNRAVAGEYGDVAAYVPPPPPTEDDNKQKLAALLRAAADKAWPLQSVVALGVATDAQKAQLLALQQYTVDVMAVDLTQGEPDWPLMLG
jgi:hypothetical protein